METPFMDLDSRLLSVGKVAGMTGKGAGFSVDEYACFAACKCVEV